MELTGRDGQTATFSRILTNLIERPVSAVLVAGGPGTGRTALLREFRRLAVRSGFLPLLATGFRGERRISFGIVEQLANSAGTSPGIRAGLDRFLEAGVTHGSFAGLPTAALREVCDHLSHEAPRHGDANGDQDRRPFLIEVDDIQHADPDSLDCLLYLARRAHVTGALLVLSCDRPPRELLALPNCHVIKTPVLSEPVIGRMLEPVTGATAAARLRRSCHAVSGGNPLLVRALLQDHLAASRNGVPPGPGTKTSAAPCPQSDTGPGTADAGATGVGPESRISVGRAFAEAYVECLHRHPDLLPVAEVLAVLGPEATPTRVAQLLRTPLQRVASDIRVLDASGLLRSGSFRHPAARTALLAGLSPQDRASLNGRAAELLRLGGADDVTVAEHHLAAGTVPEPEVAATVLYRAGERLLCDGDPLRAARCLRLADRADLDEHQRARVLTTLVEAEWRVNPSATAPELLRLMACMRLENMNVRHIRCLIARLLWLGRMPEASEALDHLLAASDPADPEHSGELELLRAVLREMHPPWLARLPEPEARPEHRAETASATRCVDVPVLPPKPDDTPDHHSAARRPIAGSTPAGAAGPWTEGTATSRGLLPLTLLSHSGDVLWERSLLALAGLVSGRRLDTAARLCHVLLDQAEESNCATYQAILTSHQAVICLQRGEFDAAAEHSARALKLLPLPGWGVAIGTPLSVLILAATSLGRHEEAAGALRHPVPEEMFHTSFGLFYQLARGHHLLATGRHGAALEEFLACGKLDVGAPASSLGGPLAEQWRTGAAEACLRLGRVEEAREWARRQLAEIDDSDDRRATDRATCLRLLAAASDRAARLELLRESAKLLRRSGHRPELVRTLADLSLAQREEGDGRRADATWRRAHGLAVRCGLGTPPFTVPPPGQEHAVTSPPGDRLSEAELRVASLAVSGRSNREIAAELYITVSTVEQHLTRVYRKMSVRCRADLAELLAPAEPTRPGERPAHDEPRPAPRTTARSAPRTPPHKAPPSERPSPQPVTPLCAAAPALQRGRADPPSVTPDGRSTGPSPAPARTSLPVR